MSNRSKAKGTRFETEVVDYLIEQGFQAVERRSLHGAQDRGDIAGIPGWTLELKNEKQINLAGYVDEARVEAANAGTPHFAAIVKRRRKGPADAYVVMPLSAWKLIVERPGDRASQRLTGPAGVRRSAESEAIDHRYIGDKLTGPSPLHTA